MMGLAEKAHKLYSLGYGYYYGEDLPRDPAKAFEYFLKVAELGFDVGQFAVATMYEDGDGVQRDRAEAVRWLRLAAKEGHEEAQYKLGDTYYTWPLGEDGNRIGISWGGMGEDYDQNGIKWSEAEKWFRLAAAQGHAKAQCKLGDKFSARDDAKRDYDEALKWYQLAADQNYRGAKSKLNQCKRDKRLYEKLAKDVETYRLAANQGDAEAQCDLGIMYEWGAGINKNEIEASEWFRKSAVQGYAEAQYRLGEIYYQYRSLDLFSAEEPGDIQKWYLKAAQQGHAKAQRALSEYHFTDKKNYTEAYAWAYVRSLNNTKGRLLMEIERKYREENPGTIWSLKEIAEYVDDLKAAKKRGRELHKEIQIRNTGDTQGGEAGQKPVEISAKMTKADARKIKSVIKKKMNANVSELRSNFAYASMERWTLKQAFDFIKIEKNLVEEILDDYDSEFHACSKSDFKNLCEEVYAELSLKYSK